MYGHRARPSGMCRTDTGHIAAAAAAAFLEIRRRRVQRTASDVAARRRHPLIYSRPRRNANCRSRRQTAKFFDVFFSRRRCRLSAAIHITSVVHSASKIITKIINVQNKVNNSHVCNS